MNDGRPPERWVFACDIRADGPPPAVIARRLRKIIDGLAARVAAQSELLSRAAEKREAS